MNTFSTGLTIILSVAAAGAFSGVASANTGADNRSAVSPQRLAVSTSVGGGADMGPRVTRDRSAATAPRLQKLISSKPIRFISSSGELDATSRRNLRRLVVPLIVNSRTSRIVIEGHTDLRGAEDVNERIGLDRAEEVREYLSHIGVPAEMLVVRSMGERRPLIAKRSAAAGRINRRVEIRLAK